MKKYILLLIVVLALIGTNPTKEKYSIWLTDKVIVLMDKKINETANQSILTDFTKEFLHGIITSIGPTFVNHNTKRTNFYLFSTYNTEIPGTGDSVKAIGILNHYIPIHIPKNINLKDLQNEILQYKDKGVNL